MDEKYFYEMAMYKEKMKMKLERNSVYKHYKNKKLYFIIGFCKTQKNGKWTKAVLYSDIKKADLFVREAKEFKEKFTKVEDAK